MSSVVADFVRSCEDCQRRKITQRHTKSGIKAFPTPSQPFQVLEADIFGPLPTSYSGKNYILTVVDMYSKFLRAIPLASKDAVSVSTALFQIFTEFGVCETLIMDCGTEFTAQVTQNVCRMLGVQPEFTPPYTHHCLGLCERSHSTLAERLTPFVQQDCNTWDEFVPGTVFAINSAVNASSGYSPYEVVFGCRPRFPLASTAQESLKPVPPNYQSYLHRLTERLKTIRQHVEENISQSQQRMEERTNRNVNVLALQPGDYVYLLKDPTGPGKKFQDKYQGPFIVHELCSDHTVRLRFKDTNKVLPSLIHMDRLKKAYVREPDSTPYFVGKVATRTATGTKESCDISTQTEQVVYQHSQTETHHTSSDSDTQPVMKLIQRPQRVRRKPIRFRSSSNISSGVETDAPYYKVRKVLGRRVNNGETEYLVQFVGEPEQNSMWLPFDSLNVKAQNSVISKPPPLLQGRF